MTDLYKDFDAAFAEADAEPIVIHLYGRDWTIPADPPAAAILRQQRLAVQVMRMQRDGALANLGEDDDVPDEVLELLEFDLDQQFSDMLGADNVTAWLDEGITQTQLKEILRWAQQQRGGGEGNRAARRKAGRRSATSSKAGRSSKRTSSASIGST